MHFFSILLIIVISKDKKMKMNFYDSFNARLRSVKKIIRAQKERYDLYRLGSVQIETEKLKLFNSIELSKIYNSKEIYDLWKKSNIAMEKFDLPNDTGGVNRGDRRAIFYLIASLKPQSVLEIGTHIGASTVNIASALSVTSKRNKPKLTTVDIVDVNSIEHKPWQKFRVKNSPKEMLDALGLAAFVNFETNTSLDYAKNTKKKFDFIFLDGDHSARSVYQEIPVALGLLQPGGVILLHDFFPKNIPLWSNGSVIPGPFLAVERIIKEGGNVQSLPLGKLPWRTKLGSNVTSLALFLRRP